MAWRIHDHVVRGEIDNRKRGSVHGRIWLAGTDHPLVLTLRGDCQPDLAGCLLVFENPAPIPMTTRPPAFGQRGTAGEMTAARKIRVFEIPVEEAYLKLKAGEKPPEHTANCLYLEWFTEISGPVVVESAEFQLTISEPEWRFTDEELAERERLKAEHATAFDLALELDEATEWDEFRHEQSLRESDMLGEKYRRLLEQYSGHPDGDRLIAREMGWTWLEEPIEEGDTENAVVEQDVANSDGSEGVEETPADCSFSKEVQMPDAANPDPEREGIDWIRNEHGEIVHPIQQRAQRALYGLLDDLGISDESSDGPTEAFADLTASFMQLAAKLAGALDGIAQGEYEPDHGLVIAWLKRVLEIFNKTLTHLEAVEDSPLLKPARFEHYRSELFVLREEILAVISRLRKE